MRLHVKDFNLVKTKKKFCRQLTVKFLFALSFELKYYNDLAAVYEKICLYFAKEVIVESATFKAHNSTKLCYRW